MVKFLGSIQIINASDKVVFTPSCSDKFCHRTLYYYTLGLCLILLVLICLPFAVALLVTATVFAFLLSLGLMAMMVWCAIQAYFWTKGIILVIHLRIIKPKIKKNWQFIHNPREGQRTSPYDLTLEIDCFKNLHRPPNLLKISACVTLHFSYHDFIF